MATLHSGLPDLVGDGEDLARFLTHNSQFKESIAKPSVFLPDPKYRETSVSRHGREPLERLWEIGLEATKGRKLYGAAIFQARAVRAVQLEVFQDEPPDRHAAIRRWPWIASDPELQKAQQKELAVLIASAAGTPLMR